MLQSRMIAEMPCSEFMHWLALAEMDTEPQKPKEQSIEQMFNMLPADDEPSVKPITTRRKKRA